MGLKICSLFSGSTGNCTYVSADREDILIDVGVPVSRVERALRVLGSDPEKISILVTHRHTDHISGLSSFVRKHPAVRVYARAETAEALVLGGVPAANLTVTGAADFFIGGITVSSFDLSHDVPCVGYALMCGGKKVTYMTDTGVLPAEALAAAAGSDVVMIESNHSPDLVRGNPHYSAALKRRILGMRGHLSNEACAQAVTALARDGVRHFILAHLSRENNYPELAYSVTADALSAVGIDDAQISVAQADRLGGLLEVV